MKIAYGKGARRLAYEASVYDEMESLQGTAVPRSYGYFEVEFDTAPLPGLRRSIQKHTHGRSYDSPYSSDESEDAQ
jgi:hypothetical protein